MGQMATDEDNGAGGQCFPDPGGKRRGRRIPTRPNAMQERSLGDLALDYPLLSQWIIHQEAGWIPLQGQGVASEPRGAFSAWLQKFAITPREGTPTTSYMNSSMTALVVIGLIAWFADFAALAVKIQCCYRCSSRPAKTGGQSGPPPLPGARLER